MDFMGAVAIVVLAMVMAIYIKRNPSNYIQRNLTESHGVSKLKMPFPACKVEISLSIHFRV
jgi:hypothetical protein